MYVHVVKKGETLYRIARTAGVPCEDIAWINEIETELPGYRLLPGSSLLIPTQVATTHRLYTVQEGDTLRQVAHTQRIPETIIQAANPNLHAELLQTGRVLTLPVPIRKKRTIEVNLRLEAQRDGENASTIRKAGKSLSSVSLCSVPILQDGNLLLPADAKKYAEVTGKHTNAAFFLAVSPVDEKAAMRLLVQETIRRNFFSEVGQLLSFEQVAGVHLELPALPSEARPFLPPFVRELALRVRQKRGLLYLTVPPHTEDNPHHPVTGAYDLPWLSLYADRIVWNAECGYARWDGPPVALAPVHLIRRSLEYALQHVPNEKLLLGLPFYGLDWPRSKSPFAKTRLHQAGTVQAEEEWAESPKQVYWDERAMCPMYVYRDRYSEQREVWYEDVRSLAAKLHLVEELQLAGVSCHVFDTSCVAQWSLLSDSFQIRACEK